MNIKDAFTPQERRELHDTLLEDTRHWRGLARMLSPGNAQKERLVTKADLLERLAAFIGEE